MKKTIKSLFSIALASVFVSSFVFAYDFGGLVSAKLNPSISDTVTVEETDDAYFFFNTALNSDKTLMLNSEAQYEFSWLHTGDQNILSNIFDVDLLKLSGSFDISNTTSVEFAFGRYPITDSTGVIFSQTSDGLFATLSMPTVTISGYVGYTGLLNSLNVSMLDSTGAVESSTNQFYALAHPYLPTNVSVEFPVLFGNQSLSLQADAFIDFKDDFNRYYANVVMSGPINNTTYYKLSSSFGSVNFSDLMNYTSVSFFIFPMANLSVTLGGEYASGEQLMFNKFTGFSTRVAYGSALSPQTTGVLIPNASFAWSMNNIYTGLTGKFIMSIPGKTIEKTAAEVATDLIYNLFSDLQVGLNVDWYVPMGTTDDNQKFSATVNVGVSF